MNHILITGADGFVGRHAVAALKARLPGTELLATSPATLDVTDEAALRRTARDFRPEGCLHLAAISAPAWAATDPARAWAVNLHGTLKLAAALRDAAPGCTLVYASSADIYGASFAAPHPLDETAAAAPLSLYAATKAAADLALGALAAEGFPVIRFRPVNHTGPGQSERFVVAAFAAQIARIEAGLETPPIRCGSLEPQRDFLDVRDVCAAYAEALARPSTKSAVFNLASGRVRRIGEVLEDLQTLAGRDLPVRLDPAKLRASEPPITRIDASQAARLLGWRPQIPWQQTLADVLADWRCRTAESSSPGGDAASPPPL